jgi:hypothetical protein
LAYAQALLYQVLVVKTFSKPISGIDQMGLPNPLNSKAFVCLVWQYLAGRCPVRDGFISGSIAIFPSAFTLEFLVGAIQVIVWLRRLMAQATRPR